jgi:membrane protein YqaA with SNARE-associated domain
MSTSEKLHATIQYYVQKLERFADRWWYPPLIGLLAALDSIFIVIPNDGILVASSMLIPRRWALFALCVSVGSTAGAVTLGILVEKMGLPWVLELFPGIQASTAWTWSDNFFGKYGIWIVFAVGASPLLQQPVVILAALAHTPILEFTAALFIGRFLKFNLMAYLGSHSPKLVKKLWGMKGELKDAGVKID